MDQIEQQLCLIQAVYRVERARMDGPALGQLRGRCQALLDGTEPQITGAPRLQALVDEIRIQLRS